jgi:hypothetical protein
MLDTLFTRIDRNHMAPQWQSARDMLDKLTGDATFVEVFAQAPELLEFVMQQFYAKVFFGGTVEQRYKQLARLKLSLIHGCLTCNKQNVPGALAAGFTQAQIDALIDGNPLPSRRPNAPSSNMPSRSPCPTWTARCRPSFSRGCARTSRRRRSWNSARRWP